MDIPANLELTGLWFLPDTPEKKYLGVLIYNPFEETHTLTLYGIVFAVGERISCINGETTDGKKVSLFDSSVNTWTSGGSNALSAHTVFSFLNLLIGDSFFTSKNEVEFQYLSFRCSNLAEWLGILPFQTILQPKKKGLLFEKKQPITLFSDEKVCIQLQFLMNYKFSSYEGMMKYCPTIVIKAKSKKTIPYWGEEKSLSYYKQVVDSFLDLVIGRKAFSYNIVGIVRNRKRFPSNVLQHTGKRKTYLDVKESKIYNVGKLEHEWFEPLHVDRVFLPYRFIKDNLESFFSSFIRQNKVFDYILGDWKMIKNLSTFTNHSLPTLLYNLEGLHESLFPKYRPAGTKRKSNIPFSLRLHDIFLKRLKGLFPFITEEQFEVIIDDLVLIRKQDAHAKKRQPFSWGYLFNLILLVEFAIYFLILKQTYQLESNFLNRSASGWDDLQQDIPVLLNERMKSLQ